MMVSVRMYGMSPLKGHVRYPASMEQWNLRVCGAGGGYGVGVGGQWAEARWPGRLRVQVHGVIHTVLLDMVCDTGG
jgi:hypothetical protein